MARHNKIYAGPFTEATPQVREAKAAVDILPGCIVTLNGAGAFALATAATIGKVWVAQDNYLTGKGVDTVNETGDTMVGMEMLQAQFFNVRVATGNNVAIGSPLTPAANGLLALASTSDMVVAFAEEAYNNTSGTSQLVRARCATGYLTAAA